MRSESLLYISPIQGLFLSLTDVVEAAFYTFAAQKMMPSGNTNEATYCILYPAKY